MFVLITYIHVKQNVKIILWIWKVKKRWRSFLKFWMPVWNNTFRDFAFNKEEQFITSSDGHDFWKLFQTAVSFRCGEFLTPKYEKERWSINTFTSIDVSIWVVVLLISNSPRHDVIGNVIWRIKSFFVCHQSFLKENTYRQNVTIIN